jgi:ketosteroid isomerase-like protein
MSYNTRGILGFALALILLGSTPVLGADIDDFKAAFNKAVEAYNTRDEAFFGVSHEQVAVFSPGVPFPVEGSAAYQQSIKAFWATRESSTFTPVNPNFRVIGTTGVAWGHFTFANKPKDGGIETSYGRYTIVFAKSGGKWLAVASHYSPIPSGD